LAWLIGRADNTTTTTSADATKAYIIFRCVIIVIITWGIVINIREYTRAGSTITNAYLAMWVAFTSNSSTKTSADATKAYIIRRRSISIITRSAISSAFEASAFTALATVCTALATVCTALATVPAALAILSTLSACGCCRTLAPLTGSNRI
jgi:hypothetical protein